MFHYEDQSSIVDLPENIYFTDFFFTAVKGDKQTFDAVEDRLKRFSSIPNPLYSYNKCYVVEFNS